MIRASPILNALADLYEETQAGRTGEGSRDFQPLLETILKRADCWHGDRRELAEKELRRAGAAGIIQLEASNKRVQSDILKVRLSPGKEAEFYRYIDRPSPTDIRGQWSALFQEAAHWPVGDSYGELWKAFCQARSKSASSWRDMGEFRRNELEAGRELLGTVSRLLSWKERDIYVRTASCRVCGNSKDLEQKRGTLERLLNAITAGGVKGYRCLGILDTPRHVLVAGPLLLRTGNHLLDVSQARGAGLMISESQIAEAVVECQSQRCVTVENKTSFHQRALQFPGDVHIHTSYPGSATLSLLEKLPRTLEFIHWGDADPAGFDILRELREVTKLPFRAGGMSYFDAASSHLLNLQELQLLQSLMRHELLASERPVLAQILARGRKGAFEQEHRS